MLIREFRPDDILAIDKIWQDHHSSNFSVPDRKTMLIEAVVEIGKKNDWKGIRWMTDESNVSAKKAYDKLAIRTNWVTYDIAPL